MCSASKQIDSLQHQNKLLKIELETYKLMEVEFESYKVRSRGDMLLTEQLQSNYVNNEPACGQCSGCMELQKVKLELLSFGEIIKVLHEELYKKELRNKVGSSNYKDDHKDRYFDQIKAHPPKEKCTQLMQLMERKPDKDNLINRNLIQIIPTLDNTRAKLSNLKEVEICGWFPHT
jgi:hypothetical protein